MVWPIGRGSRPWGATVMTTWGWRSTRLLWLRWPKRLWWIVWLEWCRRWWGVLWSLPASDGRRVCLSRECFRDGHRHCSCCFVICEGKQWIYESQICRAFMIILCRNPGRPVRSREMCCVCRTCAVDDGLEGPLPGSGDTSDLPVSVSAVISGPGPPEPKLGDTLGLPDFSSVIDPGPGKPFPRSGSILAWPHILRALAPSPGRSLPKSGGGPDRPDSADEFASRSGNPFPRYGGVVWMQDLLGTMKEEPDVFLRELEAGLHVLTCAMWWIWIPKCPGRSLSARRTGRTWLVPLIRVSGSPIRGQISRGSRIVWTWDSRGPRWGPLTC